jgi:hypothetical protein
MRLRDAKETPDAAAVESVRMWDSQDAELIRHTPDNHTISVNQRSHLKGTLQGTGYIAWYHGWR